MWLKIKSSFIFKKILNYIDSKRKFNTIIYNKRIQKKLGFNLIDFKRISGKFIIEENDLIKIYNSFTNNLLFEGYYSNRKRYGKGYEYTEKGELIFSGEYLNGKRWNGQFKEYDDITGKLILECEYLNGIIEGKAKEYDKYNGELIYDGHYLNGKRNGKGIEYKTIMYEKSNSYSTFSARNDKKQIKIFEGEYLNGERKEGKEYNYEEKLIYEGGYLNGKRNGKVKIYNNNKELEYEGDYVNGKKHGKGIEIDRFNRVIYSGEFIKGNKNGKGKEYLYYSYHDYRDINNSSPIFEGEYINNYRIRGKEYYYNIS